MKCAVASFAAVLATFSAAISADSPAAALFKRAREKVLASAERLPRYTCVENITRAEYVDQYQQRPRDCADLISQHESGKNRRILAWQDRLRLDVAVINGAETFSWAGARQFETTEIDKIVKGGVSGSGDFGSFLVSAFQDSSSVAYAGSHDIENGRVAIFRYTVPAERSHYRWHTTGDYATVGYQGSFFVDPETAEMKRLTVETDQFPKGGRVCRAEDVLNFHTVAIGTSDFLLPELSTMNVLFASGHEARNEKRFSSCREYSGESTIRFDEADAPQEKRTETRPPQPMIAGLRFQIGLADPIDTKTAAAGDAVTGIALRDVTDKKRGVMIRADSRLHGRIVQMDQDFFPAERWVIGLHFESIELNGVEQPIHLTPLDDGDRTPGRKRSSRFGPLMRPKPEAETGTFIFRASPHLVLDEKFHSEWVTH